MNVVFVLVGVGDAGSHLALSTLSLTLSRLTSYTSSRLTATKKHLRLRLQETQICCYKWEYFLQVHVLHQNFHISQPNLWEERSEKGNSG